MSVATYVLLFVAAYCLSSVSSIAIDNGVVGTPSVQCLQDAIVVEFSTQNVFTGKIYSKGKYTTPRCFLAANRPALQTRSPALRLEYTDSIQCNVQKQRETTGMVFVVTVVISFHSTFVTKVDRAYRIQCRFQESGATVTQRIEVSTLGTSTYTPPARVPECKYQILNNDRSYGQLNVPIRYAQIGQKVLHVWSCVEPQDGHPHCITVHSCSIFDERNERVQIINRVGCTNDRYVLQTPMMVTGSRYQVEAHVFKFADRPTVHFSCSIDIKPRLDNTPCRPPICPISGEIATQRDFPIGVDYKNAADNASLPRLPRSAAALQLSQGSPPPAESASKTVTLDLDNEISVLDLDTDPSQAYDEIRRLLRFRAANDARTTDGEVSGDQAPAYCITPVLYSSLVIAACLLFVTVVAIVGALVFFRSDASLLKAKLLATARN